MSQKLKNKANSSRYKYMNEILQAVALIIVNMRTTGHLSTGNHIIKT
uniref:Uncharacterized protein n=1 Tax=Rhizophora mucronata TaxID=61149 RepID=A0A2P2NFV3_RHIMU